MKSLTDEAFHEIGDTESEDEIEEVGGLEEIERRQLKQAMRESWNDMEKDIRLYKRWWQ